ncbi:MAG: vitamin B12-dependent ribonucleotide reductase, partial [Chloroflexi bacterium]|nr:vitamin B12-dependent ribonucleotide reductase [Chloroflexota bacterium]
MTLAPDKPTTTTNTVRNAEASLPVTRFFTKPETDPYDEIAWEIRSAVIEGQDGKPVFEQHEVEFPETWTQNATNVVASKYFRGPLVPTDGMVRENSVKQLISRVIDEITGWGWKDGYFASEDERETFHAELKYALVNQYLCFNSPVWFNVGVEEKPQCSACFILSIEDSIDSILDWYRTEGRIFKGGSGSGINLSTLRSSTEHVTAGGLASGPVSFMRGADSVAGTIKSGGKTRRAAKMVILNADHPDIVEFVESKAKEEKKAYALGEAGYDMSLDGDAWISIQFQNANNSVRVTDEFMRAVRDDGKWQTLNVHTDGVADEMDAR